eukprot:11351619-Ditylum_brightwellii.AAC.1
MKRTALAKKTLKDVFYKNKVGLTFETFLMILNHCFFYLIRGGRPKTEEEKVEIMIQKITSQDQDILAAIRIVTKIHPNVAQGANKRSYRQVSGLQESGRGRGGKRACVGAGHGSCGRCGNKGVEEEIQIALTELILAMCISTTVMLSDRSYCLHLDHRFHKDPQMTQSPKGIRAGQAEATTS